MAVSRVSQVHFVGSICLPDIESVMRCLATSFRANELKSIPDGEPGKRAQFVVFQQDVFSEIPHVIQIPGAPPKSGPQVMPDPDAPHIKLKPLEYDQFALESYKTFCRLREEGVIPQGTRFQVALPTPTNVLGNLIQPLWRAPLEPAYTDALVDSLRRIQDQIPSEDLAIQWDMAGEFAYIEEAASTPPWFEGPVLSGLITRAARLIDAISPEVPVGVHMCYGDFGHKHFTEPKDLTNIVTFANTLLQTIQHPISWLHMPVPKGRSDADYFRPLVDLKARGAIVFLGLLHLNDLQGTNNKITAASHYLSEFGIATECGLGRSSKEELDSAIRIAQQVIRQQE